MRVPEYGGQQVQLRPIADVKQADVATPEAFGLGIARSGQRLAQGFQDAAAAAAKRQDELDEAATRQAEIEAANASREVLKGEKGLLRLQGLDAVTAAEATRKQLEDIYKKALDGDMTPQRRQMISQVLQARRQREFELIDAHVVQEEDRYKDTMSNERMTLLTREAQEAVDDDEREVKMLALRGELEDFADRKGLGVEFVTARFQTAEANVYKGIIQNILADDTRAGDAEAALDRWGGKLQPGDRAVLGAQVKDAKLKLDTATFAMSLTSGVFEDPDMPEPTGRGESDTTTPAFRPPVEASRISSRFGLRDHPIDGTRKMHWGTDYVAERGAPVVASADGEVIFAGRAGGYGNQVRVRHANGWETTYSHLDAINVKVGDRVTGDRPLGAVGSTGKSTGPHLHYEVFFNGKRLDPEKARVPGAPATDDAVRTARAPGELTFESVDRAARVAAAGDPIRYQAFLSQGLAVLGRQEAVKTERERKAWDDVQPFLLEGSTARSINEIPASIRRGLSPTQLTQLDRFFVSRAKEDAAGKARVTDPAKLLYLSDLFASSPAAFAKLDPSTYVNSLTPGDFEQVLGWRREAISGAGTSKERSDSQLSIEAANRAASRVLPKDVKGDAKALFFRQLMATGAEHRRLSGKPPSDEDWLRFADTLLLDVKIRDAGFLGGDKPARRFEVPTGARFNYDVPDKAEKELRDSFRRREGRDPNPRELGELWRRARARGIY